MVNDFKLIIVDELMIVLDVMIQVQIFDLIEKVQVEIGVVVMMIMYDMGVVVCIVDDVMVMYVGKLVEQVFVCEFFYQICMLYFIGFFGVILCVDKVEKELFILIKGNFLLLINFLDVCLFVDCCLIVMDVCCMCELEFFFVVMVGGVEYWVVCICLYEIEDGGMFGGFLVYFVCEVFESVLMCFLWEE